MLKCPKGQHTINQKKEYCLVASEDPSSIGQAKVNKVTMYFNTYPQEAYIEKYFHTGHMGIDLLHLLSSCASTALLPPTTP